MSSPGNIVIDPILASANQYQHPFTVPNAQRIPTSLDVAPANSVWVYKGTTPNTLYLSLGAGNWSVLPSTVSVVTAGASPQVANNRRGQVTFSGVSIVAGATQTFVITNSFVTASSIIQYSSSDLTAGSSVSIESVTNTAGSSSIVVTNGTGATTASGNITFTFQLLN